MAKMHPAVQEELEMLRQRFPGKEEITLDDYAEYYGIRRRYASQHFGRENSRGKAKIGHKRIGRRFYIPLLDFAYWLAQQKIVNGRQLELPTAEEMRESLKNRRGYGGQKYYDYR